MKIEAKNLTRSPALVFFLIMGIRNIYSLSVLFTRIDSGWTIISSVLSNVVPLIIAAALFFRIPKLLYVPCTVGIFLIICAYVLKFSELFALGYVTGADLLLLLLYFFRLVKHAVITYMVYRFGELKKLWFLPLLMYLAYYTAYILHICVLIAGTGSVMSVWSILSTLVLQIPAYGFLGRWLAYPYKKSYYRKQNQISNTSEQEENIHA